MKQRIETCIRDHLSCKDKLSDDCFIPKRLLDVGNNEIQRVKLVNGEDLARPDIQGYSPANRLQYATLSYCWGDALMLKTTQATEEIHRAGILIKDMPKAFQDAIHVVRKLGIQYLWIDALCILQDNKEEWEIESSRMCDIFANSYTTISAAASSSASEHFLKRTTDSPRLHFRSSIRPEVSGDYFICLDRMNQEPAEADIRSSKWRSRGWVWQEELMSTRQLIFGTKMLHFWCSEGVYLENGQFEWRPSWILRKERDYGLFSVIAPALYSSRQLKFPQDRLPAIAGIAKFIERVSRQKGELPKYMAGLWLNDRLEEQLRWVYRNPTAYDKLQNSFNNRNEYIAPSWSWASANTAVECLTNGYFSRFDFISYDVSTPGGDPMVAVGKGTSLTLRGELRKTPVLPFSGSFEEDEKSNAPKWVTRDDSFGRIDFWLDWDPQVEDPEEIPRQRALQLFSLSATMSDRFGYDSGILLLPFNEAHRIMYRRVGVYKHYRPRSELSRNRDCDISISIL